MRLPKPTLSLALASLLTAGLMSGTAAEAQKTATQHATQHATQPTIQSGTRSAHTFQAGQSAFLLDGEPFVVRAAELHYPRIPRPYWRHRLQMCKALGMNAVCLYVFWNLHEPEPGVFDFDGNNDVAEFCRQAQAEGLWVILRPGPYVCAEWEMGGLPWWLLRHDGVTLRDDDEPYFLERVALFEREVGKRLAPLTVENGGPIIMVQVENEYGSYAADKPYVAKVRDTLREVGFDKVTLFQCDWASNFTQNGLDDLVWTMNFGTGAKIDDQFRRLKELRPHAPLMCSEFWSGWFDKWGARHETRPAQAMVKGITDMLDRGISFSLYMTHGGTSFGHWAGANSPGFAPDVTSYDYDAPINEQGAATPKYHMLREAMAKYAGGRLPKVPKQLPVMTIDTFAFDRYAPLTAAADDIISTAEPQTFEQINMGFGTIVYETTLPAVEGVSTLEVNDLHDYASVYIDGRLAGRLDRAAGKKTMLLPALEAGSRLTLVVEAMGRINFGRAIEDHKGITRNVLIRTVAGGHYLTFDLKNWTMRPISDSYAHVARAVAQATRRADAQTPSGAGYYAATVRLKKTADTWLDMRHWGKGQVYVNGHAIGRFWAVGPQQTLFVPGCWLRKGDNEIVVADVAGPRRTVAWGSAQAQLNLLQPGAIESPDEKLAAEAGTVQRPSFDGMRPAADVRLEAPAGSEALNVKMNGKPKGRYVAIEVTGTQGGAPAALAEVHVLSDGNRPLPREAWTAAYASSQETESGNNTAVKAFDQQESTAWKATTADARPLLVIDLGNQHTVRGLTLLPAYGDAGSAPARVKVYVY